MPLNQDVLNHFNGRPQPDTACGFGKGTEQMQENIKMGRKERIEINKAFTTEISIIILGILKLGVMTQRLSLVVKELAKFTLTCRALAQQSPITDLFNIAGFKINLNGEPVLEFVKLLRIEYCPGIILGKGLLGRGYYPGFAVPQPFKILGKPVNVQN